MAACSFNQSYIASFLDLSSRLLHKRSHALLFFFFASSEKILLRHSHGLLNSSNFPEKGNLTESAALHNTTLQAAQQWTLAL